MGKATGFKEYERKNFGKRPVEERVYDYKDVYIPLGYDEMQVQAARCMDCGVPFCSSETGCPLGNTIPEFNDLVYRGQWKKALEILHQTNNFPEFTGTVCPAPCESACVLGINEAPIAIKHIELSVINRAYEEGWIKPHPPIMRTGKKIAVIGSGPAGLAAADQLNKAGHTVTVFERANRIGGLLTYGIPDFKLEKDIVDRRINLMEDEGVIFSPSTWVGKDYLTSNLTKHFDAIVLAGGSTQARDLPVPGRNLDGLHVAMDFLRQQNERIQGFPLTGSEITAKDKNVVVIGGGDTGSDCIGTAIRQGAKQVYQLEIMPEPPKERTDKYPWPNYPMIFRTSTSQEEGGIREFSVKTAAFSGKGGQVKTLHAVKLDERLQEIPGSQFEIPCDLALFAMGFLHPEHEGMLKELGVELDERGNVKTNCQNQTSIPKVFAAGDMRRGQSLVVWAISEGRKAAKAVDIFLMGSTNLK
ncbi:glutamate synthase subunit beta [Cellulosilyticum sp. I15G10I2]|uniref:glutamate synthase subunit beta n=1 Tax=Cellulosilyticum sp. I15G10I2 TaxID=1892843 RepID=UPI00085C1031|nr:glutamate synthase subunit beta [Cellulosilyticum sp. I15G10I2]